MAVLWERIECEKLAFILAYLELHSKFAIIIYELSEK